MTRSLFFGPSDPTRPRAGWRLFLYFVATFIVVILITTPVVLIERFAMSDVFDRDGRRLFGVFVFLLATLITTRWAAGALDRRPIEAYGLRYDRQWLQDYGFGLDTVHASSRKSYGRWCHHERSGRTCTGESRIV